MEQQIINRSAIGWWGIRGIQSNHPLILKALSKRHRVFLIAGFPGKKRRTLRFDGCFAEFTSL
jgi:hypothetical protein